MIFGWAHRLLRLFFSVAITLPRGLDCLIIREAFAAKGGGPESARSLNFSVTTANVSSQLARGGTMRRAGACHKSKRNKTKKRDAHTNVITTFAPSNLFFCVVEGGGGAAGGDRLLVCEPQEMNACNFNFLLTPLDL